MGPKEPTPDLARVRKSRSVKTWDPMPAIPRKELSQANECSWDTHVTQAVCHMDGFPALHMHADSFGEMDLRARMVNGMSHTLQH